jgi:hypothetical protein
VYQEFRRKMLMDAIWKAALGLVLLFYFSTVFAEGKKNTGKMMLHAGGSGEVPFDHSQHKTALKDCDLCHQLFPQEVGSIQETIKAGKLKPKQAMNTLCIACHREKANAGVKTGPVTCTRCHIKK